MVIGAVGSGKSSLLSAVIGEMTTLRGTVYVDRYSILIHKIFDPYQARILTRPRNWGRGGGYEAPQKSLRKKKEGKK